VCLAAHVRSLVGGSLGRDRRNCQTFAASPAEPGDLPWLLAYGARRLFLKQEASEQRQLLNFVLSNSTWKNGVLTPVFRQPFDLIAKTTAVAKHERDGEALNLPGHPVWLGDLDSNQD